MDDSPSWKQTDQCIFPSMLIKIRTLLSVVLSLFLSVAVVWAQKAPYPASKHGANYMFNYYLPPAPSTTPWAPAWSPDGDWIAVAMYGSIWKVDPRTGI